MTVYVSLAFKSYAIDRLVSFATTIHERMTADAKYVALKPSVDDTKASLVAFNKAIANAKNGGKDRIADKSDAKAALIKQLSSLARKIEDAANDNPRFITDSGFELRSMTRTAKEEVTELDTPVLTIIDLKRAGCAKLVWDEMPNVLNYPIRFKKKVSEGWQMGEFPDSGEFTFTNLEPDTPYEFSVCAAGANNVKSDWSTPVRFWVP